MRKIITGLGIALTALTLTLTNPTSTEAKSKYITAKEAGKRIVAFQTKVYKQKKKATLYLPLKIKNLYDYKEVRKAYNEAAKAQYGKGVYCKGLKAVSDNWDDWSMGSDIVKKNGKYVYKLVLNGKHWDYKFQYKEAECQRKLIKELKGFTKGKNQFDRAWITMIWLNSRAGYRSRAHKYVTQQDLYKRHFITDCDGLAIQYAFYAHCAGVKHVGTVQDSTHMWNWIKVDGKRYYIDFQSTNGCFSGYESIKTNIKHGMDPFYHDRWGYLYDLIKWCKENKVEGIDSIDNCKEIWDSLTKKQKSDFTKWYDGISVSAAYQLSCSSFSQSNFEPLKVWCYNSNGDYTIKNSKKWVHKEVVNCFI